MSQYKVGLYLKGKDSILASEMSKSYDARPIIIDNFNGLDLETINPDDFKKNQLPLLKGLEFEAAAYWSKIGGIPFDDEEKYQAQLENLKVLAKNVSFLKCKYIIINGLLVKGDPLYYSDLIMEKMRGYQKAIEKSGATLLIYDDKSTFNSDAEKCLEICKSAPGIKVLFDAASHLEGGEVPMAAYRLLKSEVKMILARDIDKNHFPTVLGLGEANIQNIVRMGYKDKFEGYIIASNNLEQLSIRNKVYGKLKFPIVNLFVLASKKYRSLRSIDRILKKSRKDEVTDNDINRVQILALKKLIARAERAF